MDGRGVLHSLSPVLDLGHICLDFQGGSFCTSPPFAANIYQLSVRSLCWEIILYLLRVANIWDFVCFVLVICFFINTRFRVQANLLNLLQCKQLCFYSSLISSIPLFWTRGNRVSYLFPSIRLIACSESQTYGWTRSVFYPSLRVTWLWFLPLPQWQLIFTVHFTFGKGKISCPFSSSQWFVFLYLPHR